MDFVCASVQASDRGRAGAAEREKELVGWLTVSYVINCFALGDVHGLLLNCALHVPVQVLTFTAIAYCVHAAVCNILTF